MLRSSAALGAFGLVLVVFGACGGSTNLEAGPSKSEPFDAGTSTGSSTTTGPSGLPCDVDRILAESCRGCHATPPQFGAPFALSTWDDFQRVSPSDPSKKVFEQVALRIANDANPMPPAPKERLGDADRKALTDWIAAGAPRSTEECGTQASRPPSIAPISCAPDTSLAPAAPWEMPETTTDEYVCFGVDLAKSPAAHITGFAPKIDNTSIVHHVVLYESPDAYSKTPTPCSSGKSLRWRMVLGWAPGVEGFELPPDVGFPVSSDAAAPTHYVVQMHYANPQRLKGQKDKTSIELCTSAPRKYEADVLAFGSQSFTVPPGAGAYTIDCSLTIPAPFAGLHVFAAMPHMHKLGTAMSTTLEPKDGSPHVDLGTMSSFSFDAQRWLPIDGTTKTGDVIRTKCSWVNNTGAPVPFGEETAQEMCYSFTMYYPRIQSSLWSWAAPTEGSPYGAKCVKP